MEVRRAICVRKTVIAEYVGDRKQNSVTAVHTERTGLKMSTYSIKCKRCECTFESKAHNALYCAKCRREVSREQSRAHELKKSPEKKRQYSMTYREKQKRLTEESFKSVSVKGRNEEIYEAVRQAKKLNMKYGEYMASRRV